MCSHHLTTLSLLTGANVPASHLDDVQPVFWRRPFIPGGQGALLCSLPASPSPSPCAQLPHLEGPAWPSLRQGSPSPGLPGHTPALPDAAGGRAVPASVREGGAGQTAGPAPGPNSQDAE